MSKTIRDVGVKIWNVQRLLTIWKYFFHVGDVRQPVVMDTQVLEVLTDDDVTFYEVGTLINGLLKTTTRILNVISVFLLRLDSHSNSSLWKSCGKHQFGFSNSVFFSGTAVINIKEPFTLNESGSKSKKIKEKKRITSKNTFIFASPLLLGMNGLKAQYFLQQEKEEPTENIDGFSKVYARNLQLLLEPFLT